MEKFKLLVSIFVLLDVVSSYFGVVMVDFPEANLIYNLLIPYINPIIIFSVLFLVGFYYWTKVMPLFWNMKWNYRWLFIIYTIVFINNGLFFIGVI